MIQFAICFLFSALSVDIHAHHQNSQTINIVLEPFSSDPHDSSTERFLYANSEVTDSSTGSTSSTENPITLDPNPSWRPYLQKHYAPVRNTFKSMAKHDFQSKIVFDFFNRPSELRMFIDGIFYSLEKYRKEVVEDRSSFADEIYRSDEYSQVTKDRLNDIVDKIIEQLTENVNGIYNTEQSSIAEDVVTNDPVSDAGINVNTDEVLHRSGILAQVEEGFPNTEHSPTKSKDNVLDVTFEKSSKGNKDFDDSTPIVTTSDTPVEIFEEADKHLEHIPEETKYFAKDWSLTRFPPIKTKTVVYTKTADSDEPYDVPVSQVLKPKLVETSAQAAYKGAVASQAVEGALSLAETIARETAQLVNRITMEAMRQNVAKPKFKTVSGYKRADSGVKHRAALTKPHVME